MAIKPSLSIIHSSLFISILFVSLFLIWVFAFSANNSLAAPELIPNRSLETVGTNGDPEGWYRGGWGTNDRRYTYPVKGVDGAKAVRVEMSSRTSGDAKWFFKDVPVTSGESYTFSHQYRSNVTTELLVRYRTSTGIQYQYLAAIPPSATWKSLSRTLVVPDGVTSMTVFHLIYSVGYLELDDFSLGTAAPVVANLVPNHSVESSGTGGDPDGWYRGGWGTNDRRYTYPVAGAHGSKAVRVEMSSRTSGDAKWYFKSVPVTGGESYSFSHQYRSNVTTELLARYTTASGERYQYLGAIPASASWKSHTREFIAPVDATEMTIYHLLYSSGYLELDAFKIQEAVAAGTAAPAPNTGSAVATPAPKAPTPTAVTSAPKPTSSTVSTISTASTIDALRPSFPKKEWGVMVGWQPGSMDSFVSLAGKTPDYRAIFIHWGNENKFPFYLASDLSRLDQTLIIFWEATNYNITSVNQPLYSYDSILAGRWDSYLTQFAIDAKVYGKPVILIPFSEMNGNWFPWSGVANGNTPEKHNEAYRYIREFFRNAPNVKFGWAPNQVSVPDTANNRIDLYYPGDNYVDYVGLDGFNFGTPWYSFDSLFGQPLSLLKRYRKPIFIFSFAAAGGSQKATWITDALTTQMQKHPEIKGWVWFHENKERDWRINSDQESLNAFRRALP